MVKRIWLYSKIGMMAFAFGMVLGYAMEELIREKIDNTTWTGVGGAGHIPARLFLQ